MSESTRVLAPGVLPARCFSRLCNQVRALVAAHDLNLVKVAVETVAAEMDSPPRKVRLGDLYRLARDERGNTAVELCLIFAGIALPCILGGEKIGPLLLAWLHHVDSSITTAQALLAALGAH